MPYVFLCLIITIATGNWPGKTVSIAQGEYSFEGKNHILVDLPGTYSLMADSAEEEVARNFICFGNPDVTVVVADATCLERNLNLVMQTLEVSTHVVLCINLLDEAQKKEIDVHLQCLSSLLGIAVVGTNAQKGEGLPALREAVQQAVQKQNDNSFKTEYDPVLEAAIQNIEATLHKETALPCNSRWLAIQCLEGSLLPEICKTFPQATLDTASVQEAVQQGRHLLALSGVEEDCIKDLIAEKIVRRAEEISKACTSYGKENYNKRDRKLDALLTSKTWGIPIMILLLMLVFWITITGANYPSALLSSMFGSMEAQLTLWFTAANAPAWLHGMLVEGIFRTLSWVVSVMLPPMAIFFPLFTLLEDLGYLPRIAFNMDHMLKRAGSCGKQALTMCMGYPSMQNTKTAIG